MMLTTYDYTPLVVYAIDLIANGATKTSACHKAGVPVATFNRFMSNNEDLALLFKTAEEEGSDAMADALLEIDTHYEYGRSDPKMAKVISDNIKWVLSKRRPKDFGAKVEVNVNLTADKAITQALLAGQQRAMLPPPTDVIDVVPIVVPEIDVA